MSPFAVFDTFGVVSIETNGYVPASYIIITIVILFTTLSCGKMVNLYPGDGSAYTYTKKTMYPSEKQKKINALIVLILIFTVICASYYLI
ncbi:hypothetical protein AF332_20035 [Sporosarcina globispora]|uniref:Amino acid permease/ SLC12A domain-containing protein n=1 Tax=Sporosarcina globispora TaxID=1459 RepID=A0A0M0GHA0_SPOGL|nr:hypothetical protein AF332_20035 [Sporosarcina globispora]